MITIIKFFECILNTDNFNLRCLDTWESSDETEIQLSLNIAPLTQSLSPQPNLFWFGLFLYWVYQWEMDILLVTAIPWILRVIPVIYCYFLRKRRHYRWLAFICECLSIHHLFFWLKLHPANVPFRVLGAHHPLWYLFIDKFFSALEGSSSLSMQISYDVEFVLQDLSGNGLEGFKRLWWTSTPLQISLWLVAQARFSAENCLHCAGWCLFPEARTRTFVPKQAALPPRVSLLQAHLLSHILFLAVLAYSATAVWGLHISPLSSELLHLEEPNLFWYYG